MTERSHSARVPFPPPLIYLGMLLLGFAAEYVVGLRTLGLGRPLSLAIGGVLVVAGIALVVSALGLFRRAETPPEPWRPSTQIVTGGIYGRTRNPMYLGMAIIYAGLAILADLPLALILLPLVLAIVQSQVIAREERYLEARFGEDYLRYKRQVGRWL